MPNLWITSNKMFLTPEEFYPLRSVRLLDLVSMICVQTSAAGWLLAIIRCIERYTIWFRARVLDACYVSPSMFFNGVPY